MIDSSPKMSWWLTNPRKEDFNCKYGTICTPSYLLYPASSFIWIHAQSMWCKYEWLDEWTGMKLFVFDLPSIWMESTRTFQIEANMTSFKQKSKRQCWITSCCQKVMWSHKVYCSIEGKFDFTIYDYFLIFVVTIMFKVLPIFVTPINSEINLFFTFLTQSTLLKNHEHYKQLHYRAKADF